jgi:hypothetical protein
MAEGWLNTYRMRGHRQIVNVMPVDDLEPHIEASNCWCGPTVQNIAGRLPGGRTSGRAIKMITHHAKDGRELVETHGVQ